MLRKKSRNKVGSEYTRPTSNDDVLVSASQASQPDLQRQERGEGNGQLVE